MREKTILLMCRWFVPFYITVHNIEEAFTFDKFIPVVKDRLEKNGRTDIIPTWPQFRLALITVTILSYITAIVPLKPAKRLTIMLITSATMLINVFSHFFGALIFRRYVPGLISALSINLPASVFTIFLAKRSGFLNIRKMTFLTFIAALLHGPALVSLLAVSGLVTRKCPEEK